MVHLPPPLSVGLNASALFLDLDGTLSEIAPEPGLATIPLQTVSLLSAACARLNGALAIVSGRDLPDIDRLLRPYRFVTAAVHGATVRGPSGRILSCGIPRDQIEIMKKKAQKALAHCSGVIIEPKDGALAIHFRACPHAGPLCRSVARHIVGIFPDTHCQAGKMVVEVASNRASKGGAISHILSQSPFSGRHAIFIGDDLTDESGFSVVKQLGGTSIKVGGGQSVADYRLDNPKSVVSWLAALIESSARSGEAACSTPF